MEFQWDEGNRTKNWEKHRVSCEEAEQCFFNPHILVADEAHSLAENRYFLYGTTNEKRLLTIVFTVRDRQLVRIVSARPMHKKEKRFYEENKKNSIISE